LSDTEPPPDDRDEVEAGKLEVDEPVITADDGFGLQDRTWTNGRWRELLEHLINRGFFTWQDVATLALGQANPPQVGTSIASKETFQANHPKVNGKSTMQQVFDWLYEQVGTCVQPGCGTRLDLQADHVAPIEEAVDDPAKVDGLANLVLRCRRHNVIRRKSHKLGGKTYLTAESALMWILLVIKPRSRIDFIRMCRLYGMSMADVRMYEAWAMAVWLNRDASIGFDIARDDERNVVLIWPDNALTCRRLDDPSPEEARVLIDDVSADQVLTFITRTRAAPRVFRLHQMQVSYLPFSHYNLGTREPNALAVLAHRPKADDLGNLIGLPLLPPRDRDLVDYVIHKPKDLYVAQYRPIRGRTVRTIEPSTSRRERKIGTRTLI
jgi:hypothetical protein